MVANLLAGNSPTGKHGIYFNQLHAIHIQKQKTNRKEGKFRKMKTEGETNVIRCECRFNHSH